MFNDQMSLFNFTEPEMPTFDLSRVSVKAINYQTASRIVDNFHYAQRTPSIVVAFGMYVDDVLAGVITYGLPPNRNALGFCGEEYIDNGLELNRLFVFDWAGRNSESWLIGQSFALLEKNYPKYFLLVSYADPTHDHLGIIYQATNWIYTGTGAESKSDVIVNGKLISEKHLYNLYGTHKRDELKLKGLDIQDIISQPKHRYVYILGSKGQRKKFRKLLRWPVLSYPKGRNLTPREPDSLKAAVELPAIVNSSQGNSPA